MYKGSDYNEAANRSKQRLIGHYLEKKSFEAIHSWWPMVSYLIVALSVCTNEAALAHVPGETGYVLLCTLVK